MVDKEKIEEGIPSFQAWETGWIITVIECNREKKFGMEIIKSVSDILNNRANRIIDVELGRKIWV